MQAGGIAEDYIKGIKESRPRMSTDRYCMSFTAGSLLHHETVNLAVVYLNLGDWGSVQDKVIAENILQARTLNTLKRVCHEVLSRLRTLSLSELEVLVEGSYQEQAYLLWLAACRRYKFIADFAVEVLRERYITLKSDLTHEDFDVFFNRKSECHSELDAITPATRKKLRQVLFKMLREADLLTISNTIHAAMFSPKLLYLIHRESNRYVPYFPVFESEVKGVTR